MVIHSLFANYNIIFTLLLPCVCICSRVMHSVTLYSFSEFSSRYFVYLDMVLWLNIDGMGHNDKQHPRLSYSTCLMALRKQIWNMLQFFYTKVLIFKTLLWQAEKRVGKNSFLETLVVTTKLVQCWPSACKQSSICLIFVAFVL